MSAQGDADDCVVMEWPDAAAMREMAAWVAKGRGRYVQIEPSITSCQTPWPADILTRGDTSKTDGLWWAVEVGIRRGDDDEPFAYRIHARTVAEAWTASIQQLRESVA